MNTNLTDEFNEITEGSLEISAHGVRVVNEPVLKNVIHRLVEISVFESGERQAMARYLVRAAAADLGIFSASINDLYIARGRGDVPTTFTVPAMNLRVMAFDCACAVFRAAIPINGSAIIFEIARSEMGYSDQRPAEYTTSVLAAAIAEGYRGPVFIQGDHFQISAKRFLSDSETEINTIKELIKESLAAGFYNIDVDTSTLVDIGKPTVAEQQVLNVELSAMLTAFIRSEQPEGIEVSVGGEIGEVGGHNSTEEELRAYLDGFNTTLKNIDPNAKGLSKISIQTGTSHGGVVLPDGTIATVNVDFDTLRKLSRVGRNEYHIGGTVQHGASTLPQDAFSKFVEYEAVEVHLATNFMTMFFDRIPDSLRDEMYAYLRENHSNERKPNMTDEQFYYKTRKYAIGRFKKQSWYLPVEVKKVIVDDWEEQFKKLFAAMGVAGTKTYVDKYIKPAVRIPDLKDYLGDNTGSDDVSDLAD